MECLMIEVLRTWVRLPSPPPKKMIYKLLLSLLILYCYQIKSTDVLQAIAHHDKATIENYLREKTDLPRNEKALLLQSAYEALDNAETKLEELDDPIIKKIIAGPVLTALGIWLLLKQIPRLRGRVVEYNSPRITYAGASALSAIAGLGMCVGLTYTWFLFKDLSTKIFSSYNPSLTAETHCKNAQEIMNLIKKMHAL
jgi:hypothetical protein